MTPRRDLLALLCLLVAVFLYAPHDAAAQSSPFVPDERYRALVEELSGDRALDSIRHLTVFHRTPASPDFYAAAEWIRGAAIEAGLEDVNLVRQDWDEPGWHCVAGEAWLVAPERHKLADCREVAVSFADHSRSAHVEAPLVDVGAGTKEADYEGLDVKGSVVLASGSPGSVHAEAVWRRGAAGLISYTSHRHSALDAPDQIAWGQLAPASKDVKGVADGTPPAFAVMISPRRGEALRDRLRGGEALRVRVDLEAEDANAGQALVEGWIRGSGTPGQQIVLTSHIQEEKTSANDNASGCANMLEIGRALSRLIRDGALPRPRRDIRFWWLNEIRGQERYFHDHPDEASSMLLAINQDMVGARQSWGGRVQYAARLPWSRAAALEDVMESVLALVRDGNTELLTMRGTALPQPFTREITAVTGSREPFHARMVPYFDSSDHHVFNRADIGVPATSLINWPDDWIHSTGDDLPNIDATQLERNAVVVAAVAWYFAALDDAELPGLAAHVAARGRVRVAEDAATAIARVASASASGRPAALRAARVLVRESHAREARALASLHRLASVPALGDLIGSASGALQQSESAAREQLDEAYRAVSATEPVEAPLSEDERALRGRVYAPVADPLARAAAWEKLEHIEGLHRMMQFEALNFADGRRTGLGVYEAVLAEALAAGDWYFGTVSPGDVRQVLDAAVTAGALDVTQN